MLIERLAYIKILQVANASRDVRRSKDGYMVAERREIRAPATAATEEEWTAAATVSLRLPTATHDLKHGRKKQKNG